MHFWYYIIIINNRYVTKYVNMTLKVNEYSPFKITTATRVKIRSQRSPLQAEDF